MDADADAGGSTIALRERCSGELKTMISVGALKFDDTYYLAVSGFPELNNGKFINLDLLI